MTSVTIGSPDLHIEDPNVIGRRWRTGVLLLVVADGAFVASLIFSYFYLRGLNTSHAWLAPKQETASISMSWLITALFVASALVYRWAQRAIQAGREAGFVAGAAIALVLVIVAAVVQVVQLTSFPFGVGASAYSSELYVMAGANLFHLVLTAFLGVAMWNRGRLHIYSASSNWQVQLVAIWWTWVAVAAVLTAFATSFVASPTTGH